VVILATGDPLFYGIGPMVVERFGRERVEIMPNLSYLQLAFSRMGEPWQDARFFSLHGRGMEGLLRALTLAPRFLFLFTDPDNNPAKIARFLLDAQVEGVSMWVFVRLGRVDEEVLRLSLKDAASGSFSTPNCVVLEKERETVPKPFIPDSQFKTDPGLLTKWPVRSMVLSLLNPKDNEIIWDVGAGSGAVSISLAPFVRTVYAIEQDQNHLSILKENRAIHGAWNVVPVAGKAPEVLETLPSPNEIFVGAGGERLCEILEACWNRLIPGGMLIATVVTLRGRRELLNWGRGEIWTVDLARGSISESPGFFESSRPVWVLASRK
jgi:precorrin-6Y C5,15-methyltransferase (decarboxylating)